MRWSASPWQPLDSGESQPDVSFLPAMQRRRLSPLARMAFAVAWPLAESHGPMPLVFASRHGETPRNYELLCELARGEELSPTQFSLSVHNAIIGLWSIMRGDSSEMTAIAAESDGLEHALLEACTLLDEGCPQVLLMITEGAQPQAYRPWIDDAPFPFALALVISRGGQWRLTLEPGEGAGNEPATEWPQPLNLVRALLGAAAVPPHRCRNRHWHWQARP